MTYHESESTRKPTDGQENPQPIADPSPYERDKFTVRRKGRDWRVELKHEFVERWARVLHPLTFVVYCVLEMAADWRPGQNHGHTGGYCTRRDLARIAGTDDKGVRRALRELAAYELLTWSDPDPAARMKRGRPIDMILDQEALPPTNGKGLSHEAIKLATANVSAPTRGQNTPRSYGQNTPRSYGQNTPRSQGQNADPPSGQNTPRSSSIALNSSVTLSSAKDHTAPLHVSKATTTTAPPKSPDLTPIKEALPWIVDNAGLDRLWTAARDAAPDVTVLEVARICDCKLKILNGKPKDNDFAYVMVSVVNALKGDGLSQYRAWFSAAKRFMSGDGQNFA